MRILGVSGRAMTVRSGLCGSRSGAGEWEASCLHFSSSASVLSMKSEFVLHLADDVCLEKASVSR